MNLALHNKMKQRLRLYNFFFILMLSVSISACQNIEKIQPEPSDVIDISNAKFGQYYLSLKTLSVTELQKEIDLQQLNKALGSNEAEMNLILLYSLSNSPIYNVYTAKSQLNKQSKKHSKDYLSLADKAFVELLKDQLNQQLYLFQKLINQELFQDTQLAKNRISDKKYINKIAALELTVAQLTEQITQLKKIEQTISEHGQ